MERPIRKTVILPGNYLNLHQIKISSEASSVSVKKVFPWGFYAEADTDRGFETDSVFCGIPPGTVQDGWTTPEELVFREFQNRKITVTFAESCTGGMCMEKLTRFSGSSEIMWGGWVVYSNRAKLQVGVTQTVLDRHGAVSKETVRELVLGARDRAGTDWAAAVSGIAGPTGGSPEKPAGTVWIGIGGENFYKGYRFIFSGSRDEIREKACGAAFFLLYRTVLSYELPGIDSFFSGHYSN